MASENGSSMGRIRRSDLKPKPELTDKQLLASAIRLYEKQTGKKYDNNSRNPRR